MNVVTDKYGRRMRAVTFRMEEQLFDWIEAQALASHRTVSQQIIYMLSIAKRQIDAEPIDIRSGS